MSKAWGVVPTGAPSIDHKVLQNHKMEPFDYEYTEKDLALYALGIGFGLNECISAATLSNTYESHANFSWFPTFAVIPPFKCIANAVGLPGLKFNPMMLLHGETEFTLHDKCSAMPLEGTLTTNGVVTGVYDKKSGASLEITGTTFDKASGKVLCTNIMTLFIRGLGNFGGPSGPANKPQIPLNIPQQPAQWTSVYYTTQQQALIYRLSGDYNPLHVDPQLAATGGFTKQPILHGLCTLGFSMRGVVETACQNNKDLVYTVKCRFMKPVLPGQVLVVDVHAPQVVAQQKVVYYQTFAFDQNEDHKYEKVAKNCVLIGYVVLRDEEVVPSKL